MQGLFEMGEKARFKEGDKSKGMCEHCKKLVPTTLKNGQYHIPKLNITIFNLLMDYCDNCGKLVGIPHQSTPKIREVIEYCKKGKRI